MVHETLDEKEDDIMKQDYLENSLLSMQRLDLIPRSQDVSFPHQNYGKQLTNLLHVMDIQASLMLYMEITYRSHFDLISTHIHRVAI